MARPAKPTNNTWTNAPTKMPVSGLLPPDAMAEWERLEPYLISLGRVAEHDKQALVTYCLSWSQFTKLYQSEFSEPWALLYMDGPKCDVVHWAIPALIRYANSIYTLAGQFGMTARTRDLEGTHGNKKSRAEKSLEGNRRKVAEHKLKDTVTPLLTKWDSSDTACPEWLPARAMAEYYEIAKILTNLDLFTPLDRTTLSVGCAMYELLLRSTEQMKQLHTEITKLEKVDEDDWEEVTYRKEHPLHIVFSDLTKFLHNVWKDYGMTARYRKIFNNEEKKEKDIPIEFKPRIAKVGT